MRKADDDDDDESATFYLRQTDKLNSCNFPAESLRLSNLWKKIIILRLNALQRALVPLNVFLGKGCLVLLILCCHNTLYSVTLLCVQDEQFMSLCFYSQRSSSNIVCLRVSMTVYSRFAKISHHAHYTWDCSSLREQMHTYLPWMCNAFAVNTV